ncbi:phosphate uptake regulator PhoU [Candidatus Woesearchaeota archaeon]|nr:phosphate uptake regulator PhoU [Candidatus Woesearchaeota archaeon]
MKRKIVLHGKTSLTISLPIKWCNKFHLDRGDEVDVTENGNTLIVTTEKDMEASSTVIDISNCDSTLHKIIGSAYKCGYDEIKVKFSSPQQLERIKEMIGKQCIGFEVIEEKAHILIARNISIIEHDQFASMLKRLFQMVLTIGEDACDAIERKDRMQLKQIIQRDKSINKMTDFCRRSLNKRDEIGFERSKSVYYIIEQLEKIADVYKEICEYIYKKNLSARPECISTLRSINGLMRDFYNMFYKFKLEDIGAFDKRRKELVEQTIMLLESANKDQLRIALYFNNLIYHIYGMNGSLLIINV